MADPEHPAALVIVRLPAEIDLANSQDVGERLCSAFTPGAAVVIADLTSTIFCDSSGARQLVLSCNYADVHDAQVRFVIPDRNVLRVLRVSGIDQLLSIYPSLHAAVSAGPVPDEGAIWVIRFRPPRRWPLNLRPVPCQGSRRMIPAT